MYKSKEHDNLKDLFIKKIKQLQKHEVIVCEQCGANVDLFDGKGQCEYCGAKVTKV